MEIKVGELVRTHKGIIGTLQSQELTYPEPSEWILNVNGKEVVIVECDDYITKHSENLIDLIEVGDIVNGKEIKYLKGDIDPSNIGSPKDFAYNYYDDEYGVWRGISANQVKTILTHEQYEANCYKVKGE